MKRKAIAYVRFSASIQQFGDSLKRQNQLINEWIAQHPDYELDNLSYQDLGLSAYNGTHAMRGAFSDFMEAVEHGFIAHGTVLLVESLDRLSREKIGEATERLKNILKAGIDVVTLSDNTHYNGDSLNDPYALIKAILIAQRANEESEIKSKRMRSAWKKKREEAEISGKILTRSCPRWLSVSENGESFEINDKHAKTINQIFKLRLKGHSLNAITKILNDKKVITLTDSVGAWNPTTIEKLLGNKALIGIYSPSYQTMSKGVKEISNYFPVVVSENLFHKVQEVRLTPFGRDKNYDNPYLINIFRSLLRCKVCGFSIIMTGVDPKGMGYYVCPMRRVHRCVTPPIRRDIADYNFIGILLKNLDALQLNPNTPNAVKQLESQIIETEIKINRLIAALQIAPDVTELAQKVRELSKELRDGELKLRSLKARGTPSSSEAIATLDLSVKQNREKCRNYAARHINKVILNTEAQRCDVYLMNGLKILNFPLTKRIHPDYFISALAYIDGDTLIL